IARNGLGERVRVVAGAVSDRAGNVAMSLDGDLGHSEVEAEPGESQGFGRSVTGSVEVETLSIDTVLDRAELSAKSVRLVWSDTQGSEAAVLRSGASLW